MGINFNIKVREYLTNDTFVDVPNDNWLYYGIFGVQSINIDESGMIDLAFSGENNPGFFNFVSVGLGSTNISVSIDNITSNALNITVGNPDLESMNISARTNSITVNSNLQFNVIGTNTDGTIHDITSNVVWKLSDPSVAVIDKKGLLTALKSGNITVTAIGNKKLSSTFNLNISNPVTTISISPSQYHFPSTQGLLTLNAYYVYLDGSTKLIPTSSYTSANWSINGDGSTCSFALFGVTDNGETVKFSGGAIFGLCGATVTFNYNGIITQSFLSAGRPI